MLVMVLPTTLTNTLVITLLPTHISMLVMILPSTLTSTLVMTPTHPYKYVSNDSHPLIPVCRGWLTHTHTVAAKEKSSGFRCGPFNLRDWEKKVQALRIIKHLDLENVHPLINICYFWYLYGSNKKFIYFRSNIFMLIFV